MNYIEIGSSAFRRALIGMLLGGIVTFALLYAPQTLIHVFAEEYHVSAATASFTISFATAALAVSMLFVPLLANSWGPKRIMTISLFVTSILAIASSFGHSFTLLLLTRLFGGVSLGGFAATAFSYLNSEIAPAHIGKVVGMYVGGTSIGGFMGRVVVGTMTDLFSWNIALLCLGVFSLACSFWFLRYLPATRNFRAAALSYRVWRQSMLDGFMNHKLIYIYIIGFLVMGAYVSILNYISYPLLTGPYHLSQTLVGFIFVVNLVGMFSSVWFGRMADRMPRHLVISAALALFIVGAFMTLLPSLICKIAGLTVVAFAFFGGHTVASGWVGYLAKPSVKAQASSLYLLFYYGGSSVIGWVSGIFFKDFGWSGMIGFISLLIVVAIFVAMRVQATGGAVQLAKKHA